MILCRNVTVSDAKRTNGHSQLDDRYVDFLDSEENPAEAVVNNSESNDLNLVFQRNDEVLVDHHNVVEIEEDNKDLAGFGAPTSHEENGVHASSVSKETVRYMEAELRKKIEAEFDPDVLIIEPTGLALPHKVRDIIRGTVDDEKVTIIGICDAHRFATLVSKKEDFLRMQLSRSDYLWINKVDIADFQQIFDVSSWLRQICPGAPIFMVSGKTGEGLDEAISQLD